MRSDKAWEKAGRGELGPEGAAEPANQAQEHLQERRLWDDCDVEIKVTARNLEPSWWVVKVAATAKGKTGVRSACNVAEEVTGDMSDVLCRAAKLIFDDVYKTLGGD